MGTKRSAATAGLEAVKVAVRCRPFSQAELAAGNTSVADCFADRQQVQLRQSGTAPKSFTFDTVLQPSSTQEEVSVHACSRSWAP